MNEKIVFLRIQWTDSTSFLIQPLKRSPENLNGPQSIWEKIKHETKQKTSGHTELIRGIIPFQTQP